ncbi:hypothetical protein IDBGMNHM_00096 [Pseudomonas phage Ka2]|nr:hypothetical protein IDBGMNHM_00096 [Pseudomonas phage Ka2]
MIEQIFTELRGHDRGNHHYVADAVFHLDWFVINPGFANFCELFDQLQELILGRRAFDQVPVGTPFNNQVVKFATHDLFDIHSFDSFWIWDLTALIMDAVLWRDPSLVVPK